MYLNMSSILLFKFRYLYRILYYDNYTRRRRVVRRVTRRRRGVRRDLVGRPPTRTCVSGRTQLTFPSRTACSIIVAIESCLRILSFVSSNVLMVIPLLSVIRNLILSIIFTKSTKCPPTPLPPNSTTSLVVDISTTGTSISFILYIIPLQKIPTSPLPPDFGVTTVSTSPLPPDFGVTTVPTSPLLLARPPPPPASEQPPPLRGYSLSGYLQPTSA